MKNGLDNDPLAHRIVPAVVVYLFNQENKILLMKRKKEPFAGYWETVGGSIEFQERVIDAARREVKEETGIDLPIKKLKFATFHDHIFGNSYHRILFVFGAKIDSSTNIKLSEHSIYKWFDTNKLPRLIPNHSKLIKLALTKIKE
jgi:8-oxo-dGTP diphosphatase